MAEDKNRGELYMVSMGDGSAVHDWMNLYFEAQFETKTASSVTKIDGFSIKQTVRETVRSTLTPHRAVSLAAARRS